MSSLDPCPASIIVETTSRLHLGFMDMNGTRGRRFGSIGVSLENPATRLIVQRTEEPAVTGAPAPVCDRIQSYVRDFGDHFDIRPRVRVAVADFIPEHKGLGSGSQMALAVSTALARLYSIPAHTRELAQAQGRGKRSSIGIQSFDQGGLIVDAGKKVDAQGGVMPAPPETVLQMPFPPDWAFVILVPDQSMGLSGQAEKTAIRELAPMEENSQKICRLVLMELLPAFMDHDIVTFGRALTDLDRRTGEFFAPAQDGIYSERQSAVLVEGLLRAGAHGAGQSSWGPAVYGLVHAEQAPETARRMETFLEARGIEGRVLTARAANHGARIHINPGRA